MTKGPFNIFQYFTDKPINHRSGFRFYCSQFLKLILKWVKKKKIIIFIRFLALSQLSSENTLMKIYFLNNYYFGKYSEKLHQIQPKKQVSRLKILTFSYFLTPKIICKICKQRHKYQSLTLNFLRKIFLYIINNNDASSSIYYNNDSNKINIVVI